MRVPTMPNSRRFRHTLTGTLAAFALLALPGCRETIIGVDPESVTVAPAIFEVPVNGSVLVVATPFDKDGNSIAGRTLSFSSSNNAIATVTPDGLVIGVATGTTTIRASHRGVSGEATVTVVPEQPNNILVSPSPVTLRRGNLRQFTATPRSASGTPITGLSVLWQSSNAAIASVSTTGEVTAVAPGNVIITASVNNISGSSQVTVTEIPIGSITLSPLTKGIQVNESFIPDVTLRDTASNVISSTGRTLNWSSNNELNATVSNSGVVTGRRAGTARITASSPDDPAINGSLDVTVSERTVQTVIISPRSGSLRLSVARQLSAQLLDSLSQNVSGRVVNWTSLNPTVASVSANGSVTGLSLGSVSITAQVDNAVDTVSFMVTKIPVASIDISPPQASVIQGKTIPLSATVTDSVGNEVTDRPLVWLTSNQNTASVVDGMVTGVSTGTATITATVENRSGTARVTVLQVPVDSIRLVNPADEDFDINAVAPGNQRQVQLQLLDADGGTVLGQNLLITSSSPSVANATWNQSSRILTVTATSGVTSGTTTITVQALGQSGNPEGKTTEITVQVLAVP